MNTSTVGTSASRFVSALMHLGMSITAILLILQPLNLFTAVFWFVIPFLLWLTSPNQFLRQHAGNAFWYALRIMAIAPMAYFGISLSLISKMPNGTAQAEQLWTYIIQGENVFYLGYWLASFVESANPNEAPTNWIMLVAAPLGIITFRQVTAPLIGAYRAARGQRSEYWII